LEFLNADVEGAACGFGFVFESSVATEKSFEEIEV